MDRSGRRYEDPAMADRFFSQPQLPVVWRFVQEQNRPEVRFIDVAQSPDRAHAEARGHIALIIHAYRLLTGTAAGPPPRMRVAVDLRRGNVSLLPWPSRGCLDLEREAQEGADEDDHGQHCHAGQTRRGGDGADDVTGHEEL